MVFGLFVLNRVIDIISHKSCPKQGMVAGLWSLNMAYTTFSNSRSEMFAGF